MNRHLKQTLSGKILCIGTIINLIIVPFLFSQTVKIPDLKLNDSKKDVSVNHPPTELLNNKHLSNKNELNVAADSNITTPKKSEKTFRMKKDPWLAVLFSAIIPGAGQFYNQSYWKVPIILGLCTYFGYEWYDQNKKFIDYRDQFAASQTPENPAGDPGLKTLREFYRNQRNDFTWYFIIVYVINLIDAYVDAHLFDYDVKEEKINSLGVIDKKYMIKFHVNF